MQSLPTSTGKRVLQQRKANSWPGSTCVIPYFGHRSVYKEWWTTRCALPAASSSASVPADQLYSVPSCIASKADFQHQYRQHMETPNCYCRYGDVELYAPSEEGAAAILKTVAEPLVRCQRWLRLGNSLMHILLYEVLKMFSALGGDRELVLAGAEELDDLALKGGSSDAHMPMNADFHDGTYSPGKGNSNGNGIGHGFHDGPRDPGNSSARITSSFNGNGSISTSLGNPSAFHGGNHDNGNSTSHRQPHGAGHSNGNGSSKGSGLTCNDNDEHSSSSRGNCWDSQSSGERHTPSPPSPSPSAPSPGFLLLRVSSRERGSGLSDPTSAGLRCAFASGTASPLLVVEVYGDSESGSRSGIREKSSGDGGFGVSSSSEYSSALCMENEEVVDAATEAAMQTGGSAATAAGAKYRLWARMMEAALVSKGSVPVSGSSLSSSRQRRVHVAAGQRQESNGLDESNANAGNSLGEEVRPVILWGLLTDLKCWRFYCLRETTSRHVSTDGNSNNGVRGSGKSNSGRSPKFEILGSRRLRVADATMTTWPGLVPALAALYAILCTADGLAVRRSGDASQALTYEMPHDPHRDRLMRLHLIMGAPNTPLYGAVGEWVRQRLDEYIQCRHEQKRLRQAAESAAVTTRAAAADVVPAVAAAAAARAAAARVVTAGDRTQDTTSSAVVSGQESKAAAASVPAEVAVARLKASQSSRATAVTAGAGITPTTGSGAATTARTGPTIKESGQLDPGDEAEDEKGVGGLAAAAALAETTTDCYKERLAVAVQRLAEARERASRLRLHAQTLGLIHPRMD